MLAETPSTRILDHWSRRAIGIPAAQATGGAFDTSPPARPRPTRMTASVLFNRQQSRRVDQLAIQSYGMSGLVLMENAGRGVADWLERQSLDGHVVICCGKGNNAGDGFVVARHLDLRGHAVRVLLWTEPNELAGDAAANFKILTKTDVPIDVIGTTHDSDRLARHLDGAAWAVDALLGTGAKGEPRPPLDRVIDDLNASNVPILAIDLPSGLDCDTGQAARHTIRAQATCTFVASKQGFAVPGAEQFTGRVSVLDIGVPRKLIAEIVRSIE